jgi:Ca2+-dependent lipid-binding protein
MKVELSLHGMKFDGSRSSDPFCVVTSLATQPGAKAQVLGSTETIHNTISPHWVKVFVLDYELGTPVKVACNVFDAQKGSKGMGSAVFEIGALLGARGNTMAKKVRMVHVLSWATLDGSVKRGARGRPPTMLPGWLKLID